MFEISKNISINVEIFDNSKIYTIDNFYQDPDSVSKFFLETKSNILQNGIWDNVLFCVSGDHNLYNKNIIPVYEFLSSVCEQPAIDKTLIKTNLIKLFNVPFNDYKNNYWSPHIDAGYNGIVYLNQDDEHSGTNLYESLESPDNFMEYQEQPFFWVNKNKYKLVKTLFPRYNRMILFDGLKFLHGMNICNDDYFSNNYRLNQVFFFKQND